MTFDVTKALQASIAAELLAPNAVCRISHLTTIVAYDYLQFDVIFSETYVWVDQVEEDDLKAENILENNTTDAVTFTIASSV